MIDHQVIEKFRRAKRVLFITGAGISADSGLPTYRGIGGLYNEAHTEDNIPIEEAVSGGMLKRRPELTWKYINQMRQVISERHPNDAHRIIAQMEDMYESILILTQNVDRYHQEAGSRNVIDIHGDIWKVRCLSCGYNEDSPKAAYDSIPPLCHQCETGYYRPEVVLFNEMLDTSKLTNLSSQFSRGFDIICAVGTTAVFPYIQEPIIIGKQSGIYTVEINPTDTLISSFVDAKISLGAASAFRSLWEGINS